MSINSTLKNQHIFVCIMAVLSILNLAVFKCEMEKNGTGMQPQFFECAVGAHFCPTIDNYPQFLEKNIYVFSL